jgi:hypothetical protein
VRCHLSVIEFVVCGSIWRRLSLNGILEIAISLAGRWNWSGLVDIKSINKGACNYRDILSLILLMLEYNYLEKRFVEILPDVLARTSFIVENVC